MIKGIDKAQLRISLGFRSLLILTAILSIFSKDWINLALPLVTLFLTFLPSIIARELRIEYPSGVEITILLFIFASMYLGELQAFYQRFWWWDLMLHSLSGLIIATIGFSLTRTLNRQKKLELSPGFLVLFAFSFAMAMGVIWEIFEFSMDFVFGLNMQKTGLIDTMWDLIVNAMGALAVSVIGYLYLNRKIKVSKWWIKVVNNFLQFK